MMLIPQLCLLAFAGWTLALVLLGVLPARLSAMVSGGAKINDFRVDVPHGSERYKRLMRAHANCVENLVVFASIIFVVSQVGYASPALDALCIVVVVARVGQSLTHIVSGSAAAVHVRFSFFLVQVTSMVAVGALTLRHALA